MFHGVYLPCNQQLAEGVNRKEGSIPSTRSIFLRVYDKVWGGGCCQLRPSQRKPFPKAWGTLRSSPCHCPSIAAARPTTIYWSGATWMHCDSKAGAVLIGVRGSFRGRVNAHLDQRVHNLEEVEFLEIGIGRVKSPHSVLPQDCGNVRVGNQIPVNAGRLRHLRIVRSKRIRFLNDARPREPKQLLDIAPRDSCRHGVCKNRGMCRDALVGHQYRPCEAQNVRIFAPAAQKCFGSGVKLRAFVRGVQQ